MKKSLPLEGTIPGIPIGSTFPSREALRLAGVHNHRIHGVQGQKDFGCQSIVLNGGYETDQDFGDRIWYTGAGGQENRVQVANQSLDDSSNLSLLRSVERQNPIRVTRGPNSDSKFRPLGRQFRYDGLYRAVDVEETRDSRGFLVYRFLLVAIDDNLESFSEPAKESSPPPRGEKLVRYFQRKAALAFRIKEMYENRCQICGTYLQTKDGFVSEAAHIHALGLGGVDELSNLLCLCPNHHSLFDGGGIWIDEHFVVRDFENYEIGVLEIVEGHVIDKNSIQLHRDAHFPVSSRGGST